MKTAAVRENDSRGRHTTTHRALIPLPSGRLPDRHARHARAQADRRGRGGRKRFADIEALAEQCKFRDCAHQTEPGCAVRAAIEAGDIAERSASPITCKLRDEVAGAADKLAARLAQKAAAKVPGKALNKRLDDKYGRH